MSQVSIQGYDAIIRGDGAVRYRFNKKLIKEVMVPAPIKEQLNAMAEAKKAERIPTMTPPVDSGLQEPTDAEPLLDEEDLIAAGIAAEAIPSKKLEEFTDTSNVPAETYLAPPEPLEEPEYLIQPSLEDQQMADDMIERVNEVIAEPSVDISVVEALSAMSIHEAPLQDIAMALKERFGIYTVFLGEFPLAGQISPVSGEPMTRFDVGALYQQAVRAQARGIVGKTYEAPELATQAEARHLRQYEHDRAASEAPIPEETVKRMSFQERTGVGHANRSYQRTKRYDGDSVNEDPVTEPPLRGQIIDPHW